LTALRQATAAQHRAIESRLRLDSALPLDRYIAVLQGFERFLAAWEPLLEQALPERLRAWFAPRRRGARVAEDLRALHAPRSEPAPLDLPLDTPAAAFGSLYVLEGSALGAQVIAPRLARQLGLHAHNGAAYFAGHGEHTAARWREFRELLEREVATDEQRAAACAAAVATFAALQAAFELPEDEPLSA
jgi:heme oxygenase